MNRIVFVHAILFATAVDYSTSNILKLIFGFPCSFSNQNEFKKNLRL